MQFAQFRQRKHAVVPIAARLVGINGIGRQQFARGIHHRHFHAGAYARVEPHHGFLPGRCGQKQVAHIGGEDFDRGVFRRITQALE